MEGTSRNVGRMIWWLFFTMTMKSKVNNINEKRTMFEKNLKNFNLRKTLYPLFLLFQLYLTKFREWTRIIHRHSTILKIMWP